MIKIGQQIIEEEFQMLIVIYLLIFQIDLLSEKEIIEDKKVMHFKVIKA